MTYEERLLEVIPSIRPTDSSWQEIAWQRLDSLTKPARSLGRLEVLAAQVACVQQTDRPSVASKAIVLAAGDHGVVAQGISPFPQEVTAQMVANFARGGAAINQVAEWVDAELVLLDVGVAADLAGLPSVRDVKVRAGSADMSLGPAMTRDEAARALCVGIDVATELAGRGVTLIGTGEMGIGNSTAAAALAAAFCKTDPAEVVGPGTGLDAEGVAHKASIVRRALQVNDVNALDALGALAAVGGLEIAALAGVVIGAAASRVCVVADGFISGSAALAAVRLCPECGEYLFPSHLSAEPGHAAILREIAMTPVLDLDMRLGEGTGAALAMGIIDAACRAMSGMATFAEAGVSDKAD